MGSALTNFEKQQQIFNEFIENTQDRFDLIIRDGVNIIFDKNFIQFDDLVVIRSSIRNLIPEVIFKNNISEPAQFQMVKNILDNFDEVCSVLKEYMTLYTHMSEDFSDRGVSSDENYMQIVDGIKGIAQNNPDALNGRLFFIKKDKNEAGEIIEFRLSIDCYGSTKKTDADISYLITNTATGESTNICNYKIDKNDMPGDIAYQVANQVCSHIEFA